MKTLFVILLFALVCFSPLNVVKSQALEESREGREKWFWGERVYTNNKLY